jgi:glutathione S-transferase
MMKVFVGPVCNFSAKVRLAIAEKALAAELIEVPYSLESGYSPKHPEVLAVNPRGSVPVLVAGDLAIYDSTVIVEYLEDLVPDPPLYPRAPAQRARCRLIESEADEVLWPLVRALRSATAQGDAVAITAAKRDLEAHYARLEEQLGDKPYLCRDFSVADIATGILVHLLDAVDAAPTAAFESTSRWYSRVCARPSFAQLIEQRRATLQRLKTEKLRAVL